MTNNCIIKSGDIENVLKRDIRLAIVELYGWDVGTKEYVNVPTNESIESELEKLLGKNCDLKQLVKMIKIGILNGHDLNKQLLTIQSIINEQAMIDYNEMEEEWEMENINEMNNESSRNE